MKAKLKDRQFGDIVRDGHGNLWVVAYDLSHYYRVVVHKDSSHPGEFRNNLGLRSLKPKDMVKPLTLLVRDGEAVA